MRVEILLEELDDHGFRASVSRPLPLSADAPSRDEAIAALRRLLASRLANSELLEVDVEVPPMNPLRELCEGWADHPDREEVLENMREYRQQVDLDPERL